MAMKTVGLSVHVQVLRRMQINQHTLKNAVNQLEIMTYFAKIRMAMAGTEAISRLAERHIAKRLLLDLRRRCV